MPSVIESLQLDRSRTVLSVVDYQERLFAVMDTAHRERALQNVRILLEAARVLSIPVVATEQYPKGLGRTIPEVVEAFPTLKAIEKTEFACPDNAEFMHVLEGLRRPTVLLAGMETHICVYQTALKLLEKGYLVHVIADACLSRRKLNWKTGLRQCDRAGAVVTTTESAVFQLLGRAGTDEFRAVSKLMK